MGIFRRLLFPAIAVASLLPIGGGALEAVGLAAIEPAAAVPRTAQTRSCPAPGGLPVPTVAVHGSGIVVQGHGWGHGLGMSQYGAEGAARLGCSHAEILAAYYRQTHLTNRAMSAPVDLTLLSTARRSTVYAEGAVSWVAAGRSYRQPARSTWSVATSGGRTTVTSHAGAVVLRVASRVTVAVRHAGTVVRLRGFTSTAASASAAVDLRLRQGTLGFTGSTSTAQIVETITGSGGASAVDRYLWGLAEVPVSWPQEALRAQADAARTYLSHSYDRGRGRYVIGVTTAAQVYRGAGQEDVDARYRSPWRTAVTATHDEVIVDPSGTPIWAMYSSSDGGHAESRAYVYGSQAGFGYLVGLDDSRWDLASDNPRRSWAKVFDPADLARRLGFSSVSAVAIAAAGSPGRSNGLVVTGVRSGRTATVRYTGSQVRSRLGLLSPVIAVSWPGNRSTSPTSTASPTRTTAPGPAPAAPSRSIASAVCSGVACASVTARFSGARSLVGITEAVRDRVCNHRRAYVRLLVRYTDRTTELTTVRYAANRCRPPTTRYAGLTWRASRSIAGFAAVVGESHGRPVFGPYRDNPFT